jgi:hypothetical protein
MAKFRAPRPKGKAKAKPQGALGCVILILLAMVGVMLLIYAMMSGNANR